LNVLELIIRNVSESDFNTVETITREAFWNLYQPGCEEHLMVHNIRNHSDYLPAYSFVACVDKQIIGVIFCTKSNILDGGDNLIETISFGPVCVSPTHQKNGIGSSLIKTMIESVWDSNYPAIIIQGDPHNYCKFGFKNGKDYNISDKNGRFPLGLLVLELKKEFDKRFKSKVKGHQPSQDVFNILVQSYLIDVD
jgi:predicted N-acetyltransferase YhbS